MCRLSELGFRALFLRKNAGADGHEGAGAAGNAGNIMALDIGSKVFKLYDR